MYIHTYTHGHWVLRNLEKMQCAENLRKSWISAGRWVWVYFAYNVEGVYYTVMPTLGFHNTLFPKSGSHYIWGSCIPTGIRHITCKRLKLQYLLVLLTTSGRNEHKIHNLPFDSTKSGGQFYLSLFEQFLTLFTV